MSVSVESGPITAELGKSRVQDDLRSALTPTTWQEIARDLVDEFKLPPILLENGADTDLVDLYGQTCLHLSIRYRHEEFRKWLISWKTGTIFEQDAFGST